MLVQLLALYTDPESHDAQRYRQTDKQMDDNDDANSSHTVYQYDRLTRQTKASSASQRATLKRENIVNKRPIALVTVKKCPSVCVLKARCQHPGKHKQNLDSDVLQSSNCHLTTACGFRLSR